MHCPGLRIPETIQVSFQHFIRLKKLVAPHTWKNPLRLLIFCKIFPDQVTFLPMLCMVNLFLLIKKYT